MTYGVRLHAGFKLTKWWFQRLAHRTRTAEPDYLLHHDRARPKRSVPRLPGRRRKGLPPSRVESVHAVPGTLSETVPGEEWPYCELEVGCLQNPTMQNSEVAHQKGEAVVQVVTPVREVVYPW